MGREEPQFVLLEPAAQRHIDVIDIVLLVDHVQATSLDLGRQVGARQVAVGAIRKNEAREDVAALFRDEVRLDTAELVLGRLAAELDAHFLGGRRIEVEAAALALRIESHPVQQHPRVACPAAVDRNVLADGILVATDVLLGGRNDGARDDRGEPAQFPVDRERKELLARDHPLLDDVLNVHDGGLAGDGDRLLEGAHAQVDIDRRCEVRRQLDAVALDRAEPRQGERDAVGAGQQIDDLVLTLIIGNNGANLFDQDGTAGFHRNAGQHPP